MSLSLSIGLNVLRSYRRLAYTPWHAIAEFVDNATQSYYDHKAELDEAYCEAAKRGGESALGVSIVYDKDPEGRFLRIADNAMGMSYSELERALAIGTPPPDPSWRSKYGMGLKTAASWMGNVWSVRTKRLGDSVEYEVVVDIEAIIAEETGELEYRARDGRPKDEHYTIVGIQDLNREFKGRTLGKIRSYLSSMYREDFRREELVLSWRGEKLRWEDMALLRDRQGNPYRRPFTFNVGEKGVRGWVGILDRGTRANAGFSILHCRRVVRGWPDAWRPSSLYGQIQGSNDLVNQRLVGEVHLDQFDVSHTKDDILWVGGQEEEIEAKLEKVCAEYRNFAKEYRKRQDDERGPSPAEVDAAVDELRKELLSPEMVDRITIQEIPSPEEVEQALHALTTGAREHRQETFSASVGGLLARVYLASDVSINDPYVATDSAKEDEVLVLVNVEHPHWRQIKGSDGVLNYLRHCTYDAIAEWQARRKRAQLDPGTIKLLKDRLLRVSFHIERHEGIGKVL